MNDLIIDHFLKSGDFRLSEFVKEIAVNKKVKSFKRKLQLQRDNNHHMQTYQDRHYFEICTLGLLGKKEGLKLLDFLDRDVMVSAAFESTEVFSILWHMYRKAPPEVRKKLRGDFNSGFNSPLGMIPLAHELHTAHQLNKLGFEIEFSDLFGIANYDFEVSRNGHKMQIDCKVVAGDNGKTFKLLDTDQVFAAIFRTGKKKEDVFKGQAVIIHAEGKEIKNLTQRVKKLLPNINAETTSVFDENGEISIHLSPITEELYSNTDHTAFENGNIMIRDKVVEGFVENAIGKKVYVEWYTGTPEPFGADQITSIILCSDHEANWKQSCVKAVKSSLLGQLKGQKNPFIFMRFTDWSFKDGEAYFNTNFSTGLNPLDHLYGELMSDAFIKRNLAGIIFLTRPSFRESTIRNPTGGFATVGEYRMRAIANRNHPHFDDFEEAWGGTWNFIY